MVMLAVEPTPVVPVHIHCAACGSEWIRTGEFLPCPMIMMLDWIVLEAEPRVITLVPPPLPPPESPTSMTAAMSVLEERAPVAVVRQPRVRVALLEVLLPLL